MALPVNDTLHTLYEKMRKCNPSDKNAVIFCDGSNQYKMSSNDLHECMKKISSILSFLSASNEVIACCCGPGVMVPAILLGVLQNSSAFFVLDLENTNFHLENAMKYVSVDTIIAEEIALKVTRLKLCPCWSLVHAVSLYDSVNLKFFRRNMNCCEEHGNLSAMKRKCIEGLAYVIETTGSTGCPKIVQVPHQCIVPNIVHLRSLYGANSSDVIFLASPLTFDPSVIDIFLALAVGATLIIVPEHVKQRPRTALKVILENCVTLLQVTPSFLLNLEGTFLKTSLLGKDSPLRVLSLGGEPCPVVEKLQALRDPKNQTKFFNLYGVTELSCWAMYKEIVFNDISLFIPLGEPMLDTIVDVCSESGQTVHEGYGQLFIGGPKRYCVINNEELRLASQQLRATGDWVYKSKNGEIFYEGRQDDIVKWHGKKFHFSTIDKVLSNCSEVINHTTIFQAKEDKILVFIVMSKDSGKKEEDLSSLMKKELRAIEPNFPVIEILFVPHIPVNRHGKADVKRLLHYASKNFKQKHSEKLSEENILNLVTSLWKNCTMMDKIENSDNFILSGGNSVSAIQFILEVEQETAVMCPSLLDVLLNCSFKDVIQLLSKTLLSVATDSQSSEQKKKCKKKKEGIGNHVQGSSDGSEASSTYNLRSFVVNSNSKASSLCYKEATRRGYRVSCFCENLHHKSIQLKEDEIIQTVSFKSEWKHDLGKCIDASVCAASYVQQNFVACFIGSHSGHFCAVDVQTEKLLWELQLPDRIESSACLSACGRFVLVGCYDHHLYCFETLTGVFKWKMQTEAEIKSSPVVSEKNIAYVGSHDHNLYAIDVENGAVLWKKVLGKGSIFSSPGISTEFVCAATLDGVIAALTMDSGRMLWSYSYGKPFFSSPLINKCSIFIGCVDGFVLKFDYHGKLIAKYLTGGPVFSSPAACSISHKGEDMDALVCGSHDNHVYCYSDSGHCIWTYNCGAPVYSTPFVFTTHTGHQLIVVSCVKGEIFILDSENGTVIFSSICPGEIFSSPVVLNSCLMIGCRDNNVYIFKL